MGIGQAYSQIRSEYRSHAQIKSMNFANTALLWYVLTLQSEILHVRDEYLKQ